MHIRQIAGKIRKFLQGYPQAVVRAISPPAHVICATYFFPFSNILRSNPINNKSISPPTLANVPPTPKDVDNHDF